MHQLFVPPEAITNRTIAITNPRDLHHLLRVLRVKVGEPIVCMSGTGERYRGTISQCSSQRVMVEVTDVCSMASTSQAPVILAQALLPPDRFDWVIEKATELGVSRVIPIVTNRTVVRITHEQAERKRARWERIATAAAQQSGSPRIPHIEPPQPFAQVIERAGLQHSILIPTLGEHTIPLASALAHIDHARPLLVCIGPEGDFTPQEIQRAVAAGALAVSLGPRTLRSETAAIASLAILQHELSQP